MNIEHCKYCEKSNSNIAISVLLLTLSLSYSHFKDFFTIKSLLFQVVRIFLWLRLFWNGSDRGIRWAVLKIISPVCIEMFEIVVIFAISCNSCAFAGSHHILNTLNTQPSFTFNCPCHYHLWVQTVASATKTREACPASLEAELWWICRDRRFRPLLAASSRSSLQRLKS